MKHFTHPQKRDWRDLVLGMQMHASKHNTPGGQPPKTIISIEKCINFCERCGSDNTLIVTDDTLRNCIFNPNGKSFWEEVDDLHD